MYRSGMTDSERVLVTLAVTVAGSGLGTTIVAALFKKRFDAQLETHKSLLQRSGRIHERQLDALLAIHSNLERALFYLQRAASAGKLEGEAGDQELLQRMSRDLAAASEVFAQNKLLIGPELMGKLDEFFDKMLSPGMNLKLALDPLVPDGEPRAKLWDEARKIAYRELPSVLEAIRDEAKAVIHS